MVKGRNDNHPKKGSSTFVEPIKSLEDIDKVKRYLKGKPLYYAAFVVGINTNLRASDLLSIKISHVWYLHPLDELVLKEKKTGKQRRISLNKQCIAAICYFMNFKKIEPGQDYLFTGQRGRITVESLNAVIKKVCKDVGLTGNYGSHTLRKTWGYHQRVTFGAGLPELMEAFNHSSQRQTLRYLCIQPEEIKRLYEHEL